MKTAKEYSDTAKREVSVDVDGYWVEIYFMIMILPVGIAV